MRNILCGVAAASLALTLPVAAGAQPEGKGKPEKAERGGGKPDRAEARGNGNGNRGNGNAERGGPPDRAERGQARGNKGNDDRGRGNERVRVARDNDDRRGPPARANNGRGNDRMVVRDDGRFVVSRDDRRDIFDYRSGAYRYGDANGRGLVNGCPPGLAKKNNGCLPPGQARNLYGQRVPASYADRRLSGVLSDWFGRDDRYDYRYGDDYIYRLGSNGLIDALIPLYDRRGYYYPVGSRYPSAYDSYNLPYQYRSYYDDPYYRYGDGAIYRVDPETQLIRSVVSLLTGDLGVGQPLPSSYSVYNVPHAYRDTYYDSPQNMYRYSDGYIYRVDPTTMLIAEVIEAVL
ncbi:hypothetical protein [Sphingomicrobium aestuariivivum]|uniref:hypothetical protein n=1 Tax=Sphingomicrobium aestuariivivum TaxID=1582356 RepID=UPI001FD6907E|nr:hypothetical protein [Sphingomicrobium aestuariivivum]MCJ8191216.1 hypothetical protein [Sphingomicrobium aestuariivivum]